MTPSLRHSCSDGEVNPCRTNAAVVRKCAVPDQFRPLLSLDSLAPRYIENFYRRRRHLTIQQLEVHMHMWQNFQLNDFMESVGRDWAVIVGAAISYLLCGMPRLVVLQTRLKRFLRNRSAVFQAAIEFAVIVAIGWAIVHYLVVPKNTQSAFTSGLSWYSLLNGVLSGRRS
jgi:hypothetical protein